MAFVKTLLLGAAVLAAAQAASCPYAASKKMSAFSSYTAQPLTDQDLAKIQSETSKTWCVTEIAPCDPTEGRRVDGSCTNPRFPTFGHGKQPFRRVLPAHYSEGGQPKKAKSSHPQPLYRQKRKRLLPEGRVEDQHFTQLITHTLGILISDMINLDDEFNYVVTKPYCCKPEGASDPECVPNIVPDDDETMRFSTQRCMNMTKPISFQVFGCLPNGTDPEWINSAPSLIEMSLVYGETEEALLCKGRKFEGGMLKYEVDDQGIVWPPSVDRNNRSAGICFANDADETRCHDTPANYMNSLVGVNMLGMWFWRHHNLIARELAARNPCWDDDKLFTVARDINIATYQQMSYYELFGELFGRDNMIASKVLSDSPGFRDMFDENVAPQLSVETPYVLRWFHTVQAGDLKFFDESGNYLKKFPIVNLTTHTGFLEHDKNLQGATQGCFRQGSGAFDRMADPDLMTIGFGPLQDFLDIMTNDLSKDAYFGLAPYVKFREFCSGKSYKSFDDLGDNISPEWLEVLKGMYDDVEDVELLAGLWLESYVEGGYVPKTFYCIFVEQLLRNIISDQHWYERPNRPNAFTLEQLTEIRKFNIALLLCNVGDTVTEIQPRAFVRSGPGNEMTSCENIPKMNFDAWIDSSCSAGANKTLDNKS